MEIKLEGRQLDIGDELKDRITKRLENLDHRFGPITSARFTIEKHAHKNEQRAEAKAVINVPGITITATKESATVMAAVNETIDTLTEELKTHAEKKKKKSPH
ncbi:MAG: ribosome-associated translation inhibitor RaiA [Magnetococcales bacterium]|nr:ribosome-associated translation inhibitor RaiA [Magnetococcales bacterium]MBF0419677.1 ribosome-associated translation inhibitor RaiA [Magnetococcales bacterium]MBF0434476.1 ribosome-associated translation inhibitor RaiA [Magnetococcales bacterium]